MIDHGKSTLAHFKLMMIPAGFEHGGKRNGSEFRCRPCMGRNRSCRRIYPQRSRSAHFFSVLVCNVIDRLRELAAPRMDPVFGEVPFRPEQMMPMQAVTYRLRVSPDWASRNGLHEGLADTVAWSRLRSARRRDDGGFCDSGQSAGRSADFGNASHLLFGGCHADLVRGHRRHKLNFPFPLPSAKGGT
jgi:hypothetical protein